jgi:hypothetical protein
MLAPLPPWPPSRAPIPGRRYPQGVYGLRARAYQGVRVSHSVTLANSAQMLWSSVMPGTWPHPYSVRDDGFPRFQTHHYARDFLADYQERGFILRCAHASTRPGENGTYLVACDQDSFEVRTDDEPPAFETDEGVQYAIVNQFMGCPRGCRLYQPRWRGALNRWQRNQHPMIWFERQPSLVKVTVLLVPVLALAIVFHVVTVKDLIALAHAIGEIVHGK